MNLRSIPAELSEHRVSEIDRILDGLEREHRVTIPLAVESGSRAWGFASPDSDYDCRFVYIGKPERYLSPWSARDVIEVPLEGDFDLNGWDLGKALKLMLKGNAVILEWLQSPIVYKGDTRFRDEFLALALRSSDRVLIARHYLHLGERQRRTYFVDSKLVPLKKLFYALRPAAALRWLRFRPDASLVPMHFPTLMNECDAPAAVKAIVADLMSKKAQTRELGAAPLPLEIARFIADEFDQARVAYQNARARVDPEAREEAARFFRETVERFC